MPFEPLRTDEPIEGPRPKQQDFDSQMLSGCGTFVALSLLTYGLAVWPHILFHQTYLLNTLLLDCAIGMIPAILLGGWSTRRHGMPGAGGFLGGAMAAAVFLNLRLKQIVMMEGTRDLPQAEFPASWQYLLPGAWLLVVLALIGLLIRREEFGPLDVK